MSLVEWAERGEGLFPPQHLLIKLEFLSETQRRVVLYPRDGRYREAVERLRELVGQI